MCIRDRKYTVETSYLKVLVFLIFFPKILSGPIERGNVFFEKLEHMKVLTRNRLSTAMQIILFGLIKKLVIADRLGAAVDAVFEHPEIYAAPALICAGISFSIQIYCDFSGYTDIAAGVAYLLGIEPVSYTHLDVYKRQRYNSRRMLYGNGTRSW